MGVSMGFWEVIMVNTHMFLHTKMIYYIYYYDSLIALFNVILYEIKYYYNYLIFDFIIYRQTQT